MGRRSPDTTLVGRLVRRAPAPRTSVRRRSLWVLAAAAAGALLSGCAADQWRRGALPPPATEQSTAAGNFWVWTWIAALSVGAVVWGLILFAAFRYRKRNDDLPPQTRYNIPIEALYTVVPFIIIGALFYWEIQTEPKIKQTTGDASVHVTVLGQKWSWTFNYTDDQVYDVGLSAASGEETQRPVLYLPVGERVEFKLRSPDVIHSFWVPNFYFKMDVIPGRDNSFQVTPNVKGTFAGRCAELCGTYHSRMLFTLRVVDRADYDAHLRALRTAGQTGEITEGDVRYDYAATGGAAAAGQGEGSSQ